MLFVRANVLLCAALSVSALACAVDRTGTARSALRDGGVDARDASRDAEMRDVSALDASDSNVNVPRDVGRDIPDVQVPCSDGTTSVCVADSVSFAVLRRCVDGFIRETQCGTGCNPTHTGCRRLRPSNTAMTYSTTAPDVDIASAVTYNTTTCAPLLGAPSQITTQPNFETNELCVIQTGAFRLRSNVALRAIGTRPLIIIASGEMTIAGQIDVSSYRELTVGSGGGTRLNRAIGNANDGSLTSGAGGGGGGGGSKCTMGGPGGSADENIGGGSLGPDSSTAARFLGGGSGGRGGAPSGGLEGSGGGAVQLTSAIRIVVTAEGSIFANGAGGSGGRFDTTLYGGGGGGGAGGVVWIEAPEVRIESFRAIRALGGGGGGSARLAPPADGPGDDGQDGTQANTASGATGGDGTTRGGNGGNHSTNAGGSAGQGSGSSSRPGAGGGGGAGCIRVVTGSYQGDYPADFLADSGAGVPHASILFLPASTERLEP